MLSSDWRRCPRARDECGRILARRGLRLLDRTPEHGSPYTQHRVTEILAWIDDHNARATTPAASVTASASAWSALAVSSSRRFLRAATSPEPNSIARKRCNSSLFD